MPIRFLTQTQEQLFRITAAELERMGYGWPLLQSDYSFPDYFQ